MKRTRRPPALRRGPACVPAVACLLLACLAQATASEPAADLHARIAAADVEVFDAFNHCEDPQQLARHASHFDDAVEFYHDTGGVTWTREAMLANTRQHACGRYTRELVAGSLQVHPVAGFGAISQGRHRFCQVGGDGRCDGLADFVMVWRLHEGQWRITRVLSYGHRSSN